MPASRHFARHERQGRAVQLQAMLSRKQLGGQRRGGQRREVEVPILHPLHRRKVLAGVFVRNDRRAERVQPFVAVGMIKVPVGKPYSWSPKRLWN